MIEWDMDIPEFDVLLGEAVKADAIADKLHPLINDAVW